MLFESEGLPGIYRRRREQRAVASAPDGVKRNSKEINDLKRRVAELEKKMINE